MKFWKSLNNLIEETLPGWGDKFLSYKDLKKHLKLIYGDGGSNKRVKLTTTGDGNYESSVAVAKEVIDFVKLCEEEIEKFNIFVVDKEEGYLIRIEVIEDNIAASKDSSEELMKIGRDLADLHGEMVLLLNYSALNYTGLVKILKKYDKLSGALVRFPFIQKVLQEPFYKTDILNNLVKKCEMLLEKLFSMNEQRLYPSAATSSKEEEEEEEEEEGCSPKSSTENKDESSFRVPEELNEIENMENKYIKHTLSALKVLKEIRSKSSTVNMFSLPPMQPSKKLEEVWKKSPVVEEVAK